MEQSGVTYNVLRDETYRFDGNPIVITRPFLIVLDTGGTCDVDITAVFVDVQGSGKSLFNANIATVGTSTALFRLNNSTLVWGGVPGVGAPAIDMIGQLSAVTILNFVNIINFGSVALYNDFNIVSFNLVNIQGTGGGVSMVNTQQLISFLNVNMTGSRAPITYLSITGPGTFPNITLSGLTMIPIPHGGGRDYCIYIDPAIIPNCVITQGLYDDRFLVDTSVNQWFAPGSQTQTSLYVELTSVKNVPSSRTVASFRYINNQEQTIDVQNQWRLVNYDPAFITVEAQERTSFDSFYVTTIEGLESSLASVRADLSLTNSGATAEYQISLAKLSADLDGTANGATNQIEIVAHGLLVNDRIWLGHSASLPVELNVYYVYAVQSVPTANTFTIASVQGGAPLVFSNGTITAQKLQFFGSMPSASVGNAVARQILANGLITATTNEEFALFLRNVSSTRNCSVLAASFILE